MTYLTANKIRDAHDRIERLGDLIKYANTAGQGPAFFHSSQSCNGLTLLQ